MKKTFVVLLLIGVLVVLTTLGFMNRLMSTQYTYSSTKLPLNFNGYRIVVISDFHCKKEGKKEALLIQKINDCEPDVVVFTGDMIDGAHSDISAVKELLSGLKGKYPMYAIDGNHERDIQANFKLLLSYYEECGVTYLNDKNVFISKGSDEIGIYGKDFREGYLDKAFMTPPDTQESKFNILLYHDALAFQAVSTLDFDLVLSGHIHGGIVRLPLIGGLLSNTGSFFPKYDSGLYVKGLSTMIVSRGIGDSIIPRFNNPSEVVCVTLVRSEE